VAATNLKNVGCAPACRRKIAQKIAPQKQSAERVQYGLYSLDTIAAFG